MKHTPEELTRLAEILDQQPVLEPKEGDYAEEETPGVVTIKRADGTPVVMMPLDLWENLRERKELEEARERGSKIHVAVFKHLPPLTEKKT